MKHRRGWAIMWGMAVVIYGLTELFQALGWYR